jgi:hypothetical protein
MCVCVCVCVCECAPSYDACQVQSGHEIYLNYMRVCACVPVCMCVCVSVCVCVPLSNVWYSRIGTAVDNPQYGDPCSERGYAGLPLKSNGLLPCWHKQLDTSEHK